ncbi:MAG: hypothetical protein D3925_17310 [Candidatus Electrothrix sp. AR5]|nr:hypothetical protein [Candidatus Electrothrix sp. AR5]
MIQAGNKVLVGHDRQDVNGDQHNQEAASCGNEVHNVLFSVVNRALFSRANQDRMYKGMRKTRYQNNREQRTGLLFLLAHLVWLHGLEPLYL